MVFVTLSLTQTMAKSKQHPNEIDVFAMLYYLVNGVDVDFCFMKQKYTPMISS